MNTRIIMNPGFLAAPMLPVQQVLKNCVVCSQPCRFAQIPLDWFVNGVPQVACSENCKNLFTLAKSLTTYQQQQQQQMQQQAQLGQLLLQQQRHLSQGLLSQQPAVSAPGLLPTPTIASQNRGVPAHHVSHANPIDIPKPHVDFKEKAHKQQKQKKAKKQKKNKKAKEATTTSSEQTPSLEAATQPEIKEEKFAVMPMTVDANEIPLVQSPKHEPHASPSFDVQRSPSQESEQGQAPKIVLPNKLEPLFVVVDTNCLIQHLFDIMNLQYHEHLTIVIPQIVIHELDHLKKSEDQQVGYNSRQAIKIILEALQANEGLVKKKFRAQATHEAVADELVGVRNNDDLIVQCALYYNTYVAPGRTVLITADAGLSLKAVMNGMQSKSVGDFLASLPPVYTGSSVKPSYLPPTKTAPRSPDLSAPPVEIISLERQQRQDQLPLLPADLWVKVFSFIPPRYLPRLNQVCYPFYFLINKDDTVWRRNLQQTFKDYNNILIPQDTSARDWYIKWRHQTLTYKHLPTIAK
mmetsp:Transcript_18029/g.25198  ORF Transcript_18029/g.25198 Transcript_18029/m.25198 type:complete len:521 (+) Transcript_18029:91-1653(+)